MAIWRKCLSNKMATHMTISITIFEEIQIFLPKGLNQKDQMVGSNAIKNVVLNWQKVFLVLHL